MSTFDDDIRAAKAEIRAALFNDARLERTIESNADRVAGTKGTTTQKNLSCKARLGAKPIKGDDGVVTTKFRARVDVQPQIGDVLNYNNVRWRVVEIVEIAPDGLAEQWTVVVQQ